MLLIWAVVAAAALGLVVHAVLPHRGTTGVVLLPAVAVAAASIVWTALSWLDVPQAGAVMWLVSLGCAVLSAAGLGVPLRRARVTHDEARLAAA